MVKKLIPVFLSLLFIFLLMLSFSSCGKSSGVGESVLKNDLSQSEKFSIYNMNIDSLKIRKRQTLPEDQVDTVWVDTEVSNESVEGTMSFVMKYTLYNDGWELNSIQDDSTETWSFKPRKGLSNEELIDLLKVDFDESAKISITSNDASSYTDFENISNAELVALFTVNEKHTYCDAIREFKCYIEFDSTYPGEYSFPGKWIASNIEEISTKAINWDILGHWKGGQISFLSEFEIDVYPGDMDNTYLFEWKYGSLGKGRNTVQFSCSDFYPSPYFEGYGSFETTFYSEYYGSRDVEINISVSSDSTSMYIEIPGLTPPNERLVLGRQ